MVEHVASSRARRSVSTTFRPDFQEDCIVALLGRKFQSWVFPMQCFEQRTSAASPALSCAIYYYPRPGSALVKLFSATSRSGMHVTEVSTCVPRYLLLVARYRFISLDAGSMKMAIWSLTN
jgi:hypothetical protein